jgi:epoxyqueuosine reductase
MSVDRDQIRRLATNAGLSVTGVTDARPFDDYEPVVIDRIRAGHIDGLPWFTEERARFSIDPRNLHETARSIIAVGVPYWMPDIQHPRDGVKRGRISRYAWGRDYHRTLRQRMKALHSSLESAVGRDVEARFLVDTARIIDRAAAARSGLGWYGKNTMILVPRRGSWVMLGELIVDIDIEPDPPLTPRCGRCTRCQDICPTGALVDDYVLDVPRCISFLTIELRGPIPRHLRSQVGDWVFGCDMCQEICPYTGAALPEDEPSFRPETVDHAYPPLHWLLRMTDAEFRAAFRGTAVMRAKWHGMARNAAVALGNVGDERDLEALEACLRTHPDAVTRGHAGWAMGRISPELSTPALSRALASETDEFVRVEIQDALVSPNHAGS